MFRTIACILTLSFAASLAAAQSLGEAARAARKNKRTETATGRVFTNESLGLQERPQTVTSSASVSAASETTADAPAGTAAGSTASATTPEEEKKKASDEAKQKIAKLQGELTQLQRELDVLQRENRLRAATFYADAGNRLRNEQKYAEEDRKYQADLAAKQKAITDTQRTLDAARDEARRAGVPAGQLQ